MYYKIVKTPILMSKNTYINKLAVREVALIHRENSIL